MRKFPPQVLPLVLLTLVAIAALIVARNIFIPDTFGDIGHYRAAAIDENAELEITYAGARACYECHDEIYELKETSHHGRVSCEVCHGPAAKHIEAPDEFTPNIPRNRDQCLLCHKYNPSRPSGFPQVLYLLHNPGKICMECHNPHNPLLPHAPEECSACHREIASEKAVSHHVSLPCTECHVAPEGHTTTPRLVRAEKPRSSDLCGRCHDRLADSPKQIPRIDLETHGEHYLCWDCHYPHFPEAQ
jgi:hypothetical protein